MKYKVEYVDNVEKGFGGKCYYPFLPLIGTCKIKINIKYKDDIGLLNHEIKHAEQYSKNIFHSIMVLFSKSYRYKCELEAYTQQIRAYNYKNVYQADWIIKSLYTKYELNYDIVTISTDIENIIKNINN